MKILKIKILVLVLLLLIFSVPLLAQPLQEGRAFQRLSTMKKIKMMEALALDESKSDKFLAKYTAYENKIIELHNNIDQATRQLNEIMQNDQVKAKDLKNKTNEIVKLHQELTKTMGERYKEFQTILNDEELAKFLLFERNFNSEIRRKIMEKGPPGGPPKFDENKRKNHKKRN